MRQPTTWYRQIVAGGASDISSGSPSMATNSVASRPMNCCGSKLAGIGASPSDCCGFDGGGGTGFDAAREGADTDRGAVADEYNSPSSAQPASSQISKGKAVKSFGIRAARLERFRQSSPEWLRAS